FAEALRLNPSEAEHLMYHAWSCYKADTSTAKSAIEVSKELNRALALNPKLGQAHLYLGYISKDQHDQTTARRSFERALRYNPNCTEALRELRLIQMRKEKKAEQEKKGLLGKMFK
ncbi:MAG: hypothetical protein OET90_03685, partial [Desulfuromonadales bacterium]|nr:hypothetical protein [Desulfuromonadales bacterium]